MAEATSARKSVLDLDEITERPFITFRRKTYDLRTRGELSLLDYHKVKRAGARLDRLWTTDELSATEEGELRTLVSGICALVLVVPHPEDDVLERLTDLQKIQIVRVFTTLPEPGSGLVAAPAGADPDEAPPSSPIRTTET